MKTPIQETKKALRAEVSEKLVKLTETQRAERSQQARDLLTAQSVWREAKSVLFFAPTAGELDVWPLMEEARREGKVIALPRFVWETAVYEACAVQDPAGDLVEGRFGIREPAPRCAAKPLNMLDFILVPGIAFDLHGRRLGRGRGFYDRLLAAVRGTTCGVAFDEQIVREIPAEPHDAVLNCILTPTRWVRL
jgi:5-formyltetrahydrofolate cyclo-ligase